MEDDREGAQPVAVASFPFAERRFGDANRVDAISIDLPDGTRISIDSEDLFRPFR